MIRPKPRSSRSRVRTSGFRRLNKAKPNKQETKDDQRQQFLGDWRRVRLDELPQARGRLGPGAGSVQDPQGGRGCLARRLGREPPQGRRAIFHRRRALPRSGLNSLPTDQETGQGPAVPSGFAGWGRLASTAFSSELGTGSRQYNGSINPMQPTSYWG